MKNNGCHTSFGKYKELGSISMIEGSMNLPAKQRPCFCRTSNIDARFLKRMSIFSLFSLQVFVWDLPEAKFQLLSYSLQEMAFYTKPIKILAGQHWSPYCVLIQHMHSFFLCFLYFGSIVSPRFEWISFTKNRQWKRLIITAAKKIWVSIQNFNEQEPDTGRDLRDVTGEQGA